MPHNHDTTTAPEAGQMPKDEDNEVTHALALEELTRRARKAEAHAEHADMLLREMGLRANRYIRLATMWKDKAARLKAGDEPVEKPPDFVAVTRLDVLEMAVRSTAAVDILLRESEEETASTILAISAVAQSWAALAAAMRDGEAVELPPECGQMIAAIQAERKG